MRAVVDAKAFIDALDRASKLPKRSPIPSLNTVCLRFTGDRCVMAGTDLNSWLTVELPAWGDIFTCAFRSTKDAVRAGRIFDGELTVELVEKTDGKHPERYLLLRNGTRAGAFDALPPDEIYPQLPSVDGETFTIDAASLLERVNQVSYATWKGTDDASKPERSCVQFRGDKIYALDGYRAACHSDSSLRFEKPFLIRGADLSYFKLLGDGELSVCVGERRVRFARDGMSLYLRRVEGVPFNLEGAVPQSFQEEFYVYPKEFLRELNYLKDLLPPRIKPHVRFESGTLSLTKWQGCTSVTIDGGTDLTIGFDLNYMADALKQFSGESRVRMKLSGRHGPIVIEPENGSAYAMVLPVRLEERAAA